MKKKNVEYQYPESEPFSLHEPVMSYQQDISSREIPEHILKDIQISREEYKTLSPLVREYEPEMALLAGEEGLDLYQRLIPQAWERLAPTGY